MKNVRFVALVAVAWTAGLLPTPAWSAIDGAVVNQVLRRDVSGAREDLDCEVAGSFKGIS
jgi:hypothetical protein